MEKDAHYFIVGVFVTLGFFALIGFCLWLASPRDSRSLVYYTVYFNGIAVNGLNEGSNVSYRGVDVGKVDKMRIAKDRSDLIKVDIAIEEDTPIASKTSAALETQGLTGLTHLELTTEPEDKKPPKQVEGEKYPVLTGTGSQMAHIMNNIDRFSSNGLREITTSAHKVGTAADSFKALMNQLREDPSQIMHGPKKRRPRGPE